MFTKAGNCVFPAAVKTKNRVRPIASKYWRIPIILKQGIALDIPYINSEIEYLGFDSETYWSDLANTLLDAEYLLDHTNAY